MNSWVELSRHCQSSLVPLLTTRRGSRVLVRSLRVRTTAYALEHARLLLTENRGPNRHSDLPLPPCNQNHEVNERRDDLLLILPDYASAWHSYYEPLKRIEDDHIAEGAQWLMFVVLFTALLIRLDAAQDNPADQARLGIILVVLSMTPTIHISAVVVWELRQMSMGLSAGLDSKDTKDSVELDEEQDGAAEEVEGGPQETRGVAGAAADLAEVQIGQSTEPGGFWFAGPLVCLPDGGISEM